MRLSNKRKSVRPKTKVVLPDLEQAMGAAVGRSVAKRSRETMCGVVDSRRTERVLLVYILCDTVWSQLHCTF
jgi:hypothetical protein